MIEPTSIIAGVLHSNGFRTSNGGGRWAREVRALSGVLYRLVLAPEDGPLYRLVVLRVDTGEEIAEKVDEIVEVASDAVAVAYRLTR